MNKQRSSFHHLFLLGCLTALLLLTACLRPDPTADIVPTSTIVSTATNASATSRPSRTLPPVRTDAPTRAATALQQTASPLGCGPNPITASLVEQIQPDPWMQWIRQISGMEPVTIGNKTMTIDTRFTLAMFDQNYRPKPNARGFEYLLETVRGWYPAGQIEVQSFKASSDRAQTTVYGQNLILTLPGTSKPEEVVILSAHFDSTSQSDPMQRAPGAEDNGSGSAALLEAARLFREYRFERTIRIIWFTGEELGLLGSAAYVNSAGFDPDAVVGVVNLDMFGHDSDGDCCFEMHVGTLPASNAVGQCFVDSAKAYNLGLETYDYLTTTAVNASDHGSFWRKNVGAIEILENMFDNDLPQGCANGDPNPAYHTAGDTPDRLNADSAIRIVRAALATVAAMAGPQ